MTEPIDYYQMAAWVGGIAFLALLLLFGGKWLRDKHNEGCSCGCGDAA